MATKTFKIGLSNQDKQNMAQDVYERLLALTFPEYDTTASYSVGDFVVYNDQLYKCIGNTSGTWDATKWQLATLNDLLTDIESAVAFVNDKANVDGNYPTMTVGLADNLTPYSEDSGAEQEQPFISQGTGCGNGTEIVTTGDYALLREKQGNSLVVNQQVQNGNFESGTSNWATLGDAVLSVSSNILTISGSNAYMGARNYFPIIKGHKYLVLAQVKGQNGGEDVQIGLTDAVNFTYTIHSGTITNSFVSYRGIITINADVSTQPYVFIRKGNNSDSYSLQVDNVQVIDLTQMFNGDIPQDLLDHPENFFRYYNGSLAFNEGSLESSNGRYLFSTGRNLFAGNSEDNSQFIGNYEIDNADGFKLVASNTRNCFRIRVSPNADYSIFTTSLTLGVASIVRFVDKDYNLISGSATGYSYKRNVKTTPSNCAYIEVSLSKAYAGNVCITPYYTPEQGGEGYDQYYPYEEPTIVDTGSEQLLAFDKKLPNGQITRLSKEEDLANIVFNATSYGYSAEISDILPDSIAICEKYVLVSYTDFYNNHTPGTFAITGKYIGIATDSTPSGKIIYQKANPATEQGTTFPENIKINDYGIMYWLDSSNNLVSIPQGNKLFYPVNYKGFVDDAYSRTGGDASKLVIQSELSASETARDTVDTQLQNAIGGTLRQCLCVKESLDFNNTDIVDMGTLNWNYNSDGFFFATVDGFNGGEKVLCTKYQTISGGYGALSNNQIAGYGGTTYHRIAVKDTTYGSDYDTFKNAMKNVLLAYEKE